MKKFILLLILPIFGWSVNISNELKIQILRDLQIPTTAQNIQILNDIQSQIKDIDKREFREIINKQILNASMIKHELNVLGAPEFLLFLAMIESNLKNNAFSTAKAGGVWQFMPKTAKNFGLQIDKFVDERKDPFSATDAAFRYLSFLQKQFDDKWYISLMSYNCGDGCIRRAIKSENSDDLQKLLYSKYLPKETKNFIKKIIKLAIISKDEDINQLYKSIVRNINLTKISVSSGVKINDIAEKIGLEFHELKSYNLHIKTSNIPKNMQKYYIYIPTERLSAFFDDNGSIIHIVKDGEKLADIARKYKVSAFDIKTANKLSSNSVRISQRLEIPISKNSFFIKKITKNISKDFLADNDNF